MARSTVIVHPLSHISVNRSTPSVSLDDARSLSMPGRLTGQVGWPILSRNLLAAASRMEAHSARSWAAARPAIPSRFMAVITLSVAPTVAVYVAMQRYFVQGIAMSGIK